MRKFLLTLLIAGIFLINTIAHAEVKTYEGVGEYYMSDFETPDIAKQRAKQRAEQNACEQAGVFVKSYSQSKDFELVNDVIETMTSGILKVIDVQYHRENFDNDTTLIRVTIKAQIDSDDVLKWLNKDEQEKSTLVAQMEALRKANAEQERQITELKRQLAQSTTNEDKERIKQEFVAEDKIFLANQKVEEANRLWERGDYNGAIKLCNEAIELNPNNEWAYSRRGTAYFDGLKQYDAAIRDYNKALELNPNMSAAYFYRGNAYGNSGQYERALQDYNKAIELNPNSAKIYHNRGICYFYIGQYEQAIQNLDKAISLGPKDVFFRAYYYRGTAYLELQ